MQFVKGSRKVIQQGDELPDWEDQSATLSRQMSELFEAQNLSVLIGSGCSSMWKDEAEHGIPTMGPLAGEFCGWFNGMPDVSPAATVTYKQKSDLLSKVGIDITAPEYQKNLERLMEVLLNAESFCEASKDADLHAATGLIGDIIKGVQEFVLTKCTTGKFQTDDSVIDLYRRFYRSLSTRSRGLRPPWVFTTNYDLFNERALDRNTTPYSNGFTGTVERFFNPSAYRLALAEQLDISSKRWSAVDGFVHLCKLHGSVNWVEQDGISLFPIIEKLDPKASEDRVMIYPTPSKQTASFGSPYADLFREFQRQVVQDQSVLITMGYSFGDEHVNNIIFQGLTVPGFKLVIFSDPEAATANETIKKLYALGDPRVWFIWGDGGEGTQSTHYFSTIVDHLLPTSVDDSVKSAIDDARWMLLSKDQDPTNEG